jgi:hypothetical protein
MKSTCEIIQQLSESTTRETKKEHMSSLKQILSSQNNNFVIGNVKKLFNTIEALLKDSQLDIVIESIDLLSLLFSSSDSDIEMYATKLQPALIPLLVSDNFAVRAAAIGSELKFLKKFRNTEAVLAAIRNFGVESSYENERKNSGDVLAKLARENEIILNDSRNKVEIQKILQSLISHVKSDSSESVKQSFSSALAQLTQICPSVYRISRELPSNLRSAYDDVLNKEHVTVNISNDYKGIDNAITAEISKTFDTAKQLEFGIIPSRLVSELSPTVNWKQRAGAIEELEEIIRKDNSIGVIEPHLPSFYKFLVGLLNDTNYKVTVTTLQIISTFQYLC